LEYPFLLSSRIRSALPYTPFPSPQSDVHAVFRLRVPNEMQKAGVRRPVPF
jgi:hypothetical protein